MMSHDRFMSDEVISGERIHVHLAEHLQRCQRFVPYVCFIDFFHLNKQTVHQMLDISMVTHPALNSFCCKAARDDVSLGRRVWSGDFLIFIDLFTRELSSQSTGSMKTVVYLS